MIELRSDTFTLPTKEMLQSIMESELGDDVYAEDPTVKQLEKLAAEVCGKEAALLVPSGTMANLISLMVHCPRGSKVLVGDETDIYIYEAGGAAVCGGIIYEAIPTQADGRLLLEDLAQAFPEDTNDPQFALPSLICLENPHNRKGGRILPLSYLAEVQAFAKSKGIPVHMDGARIFNASVALGVPVSEISQYADSVQFCLSKGLSAPVGSMIVGSQVMIEKAYRLRKMLGGGMRQAGVIAAPGLIALKSMVSRLENDHFNARKLAEGLAAIDGIHCDEESVETNIVFFEIADQRFTWQAFVESARNAGVNMAELGYGRIRAVTHSGISEEDIELALEKIERIMKQGPTKTAEQYTEFRGV